MSKGRGLVLALSAFVATYAAAYEATNWAAVYLLDWWDPKFGDRRGNIAFGHEIMPWFVGVALLSFLAGAAFHWRWLRTAEPKWVVWSSASAAALAHSAQFLFGLLTRDVQGGVGLMIGGLGLLLAGPASFTAIIFALASHRSRSQVAQGAV